MRSSYCSSNSSSYLYCSCMYSSLDSFMNSRQAFLSILKPFLSNFLTILTGKLLAANYYPKNPSSEDAAIVSNSFARSRNTTEPVWLSCISDSLRKFVPSPTCQLEGYFLADFLSLDSTLFYWTTSTTGSIFGSSSSYYCGYLRVET